MKRKEERQYLYDKTNGRCGYCGETLPDKFHVDHIEPILRNRKWDSDKRKWVYDGTCEHPERDCLENKIAACPSCNINKHSMSIEHFKQFIGNFITSLNRDSVQYKIAKRYGLIRETNKEVEFYFEKINQNN